MLHSTQSTLLNTDIFLSDKIYTNMSKIDKFYRSCRTKICSVVLRSWVKSEKMCDCAKKIATDDANFRRERSTMSRSVKRQEKADRHHHREQQSNSPQKSERPRRPKNGSNEEDLWVSGDAAVQGQSPQQNNSRPRRLASAVEKERQDNIDRENRSASIVTSCLP